MDETRADERTSPPGRRLRVAVVFGGRSGEHAISCVTAAGVLRALDRARYDVLPVGVTRDGRWVLMPDDPQALDIVDGRLPCVPDDAPVTLLPPRSTRDRTFVRVDADGTHETLDPVDVLFPLLHGPFGEDGTLQGMLELTDTRYVGSGVLASAASMDKQVMKVVLAGHGLPITPYVVVTERQWRQDPAACRDAVAALGWPVFVKPARAGSSLGITRVTDPQGLDAAVATAQEHDPKVLVEAAVEGREIECAVLGGRGDEPPRASLPGEIAVLGGHDFYDFDAKYLDASNVALTCPADLPEDVVGRVQELSARTFEAMGAEGLARVDLFLTPQGRLLVNEINTMPGFTPISMYPRMWERTGLPYPDLVDELIALALERRTGLR